jgi:hypothetical protein
MPKLVEAATSFGASKIPERLAPNLMKNFGLRHRMQIPILVLLLMLAPVAPAQQAADTAASQSEINRQLLLRIQELEKEVQTLKQSQTTTSTPVPAPAAAPPPETVVETPSVNEVAPRIKLIVFGDVGASVLSHVPSTFEFGSLDLFMTARLSDKVSTLGEALFIAQSDNNVQVDVERLLLKYRQSDYFSASVGRYHTWVGYYNSTYNKGEFLETAIDRPFFYQFDDTGGFLPMQDVGVNFTGKIPSGKAGLNWVLELGNGRAWGNNVQPAQNYQDANDSKAINGGLFLRPEKVSGLQLGFSLRHDNLTVPGPPVSETIGTVHAVLVNGKYEILSEGMLVRHVEPSGPVFNTSGFYSQWSRAFGNWRPYFRYQYFNAPSDDPVWIFNSPNQYAPLYVTSFVGRLNGPSIGVRYDFTQHSALKLQFDRYDMRGLQDANKLTSQVAFTF